MILTILDTVGALYINQPYGLNNIRRKADFYLRDVISDPNSVNKEKIDLNLPYPTLTPIFVFGQYNKTVERERFHIIFVIKYIITETCIKIITW